MIRKRRTCSFISWVFSAGNLDAKGMITHKYQFLVLLVLVSSVALSLNQLEGQNAGQPSTTTTTPDPPDQLVTLYKEMFDLYMQNYTRIDRLNSMRDSGAEQEVDALKERIRERTSNTLRELSDTVKGISWEHRPSAVRSMREMIRTYDLYVKKELSDWEPTDEQIRKIRRIGERNVASEAPELASAERLRRVFLGKLMGGTSVVPEVQLWIDGKITSVQKWIGKKYLDVFPLFNRLLSRVDEVFNDDEADEEDRQQALEQARKEWQTFWGESEQSNKWTSTRKKTNRLLSLFRDRGRLLPGGQDQWKARIMNLKKQIGDLQRLYVKQPFRDRQTRLRMILQLTKTFVNRAEQVANGRISQIISAMPMTFISNLQSRDPEQYWNVESAEELENQKQRIIRSINGHFTNLNRGLSDWKESRETYNFPVSEIRSLIERLGAFYGKKELQIARKARRVSRFVEDRYVLSSDGVSFMRTYLNALQQVDANKPQAYVAFERAFREEHQSTIQELSNRTDRVKKINTNMSELINEIKDLDPANRAETYVKNQGSEKANETSNNQ